MSENRPMAIPTIQDETERIRVVEWRFPPGSHTGWHQHMFDYVVVPMTDGELQIETDTGTTSAQLVTGQSYSRHAGVEHDVINPGPNEVVFVEVEIKAHGLEG